MKLNNNLLAAACLASASLASAADITLTVGQTTILTDDARGSESTGRSVPVTILQGTGGLYFSNGTSDPTVPTPDTLSAVGGLVGALNVGQVALTPVDDALLTQENRLIGKNAKSTRAVVNINASVTSLVTDTGTGIFSTVNTRGGATETSPYIDFILDGGRITSKNLVVDLQARTVSASLSGNPLNGDGSYGPVVTYSGVVWTIDDISGPTSLPPAALVAAQDGDTSAMIDLGYEIVSIDPFGGVTAKAVNKLSNLRVTEEAFQVYAAALGLTEGATGYTALDNVNKGANGWGTLKSEIVFTTAVPEPATWAMLGLGLVGIGLASRRRLATSSQ